MALKISTININGFGSPRKIDLILHEFNRLDCDLFLLQETHVSCKSRADEIARKWNGDCYWSFGTGKSAGVAIFTSPAFSGRITRFLFDSDGRILSILVSLGSNQFNVINIYAPNAVAARKTFFQHIHSYFLTYFRIIGGDFNCVDNELDRLISKSDFSADKKCLLALKSDFDVIDIWRKRNPRVKSFTWANKAYSQASRLDRFFISRTLVKHVHLNEFLPCGFSDHDFVRLNFVFDNFSSTRSGFWKFNVNLLSDPAFMQMMTSVITSHKLIIDTFESLGIWWDDLKGVIRQNCINFSIRKRKQTNANRTSLTKRLILAKQAVHSGDLDATSRVRDLESALSSLISKESEGAKIRSRAKWLEEGEKPTRYFFRLQTKRAAKNSFDCLLDDSGVEKTLQADLEAVLVAFYTSLFSKDVLDLQIQTELIDDLEFSLTDIERASCEGLFTKKELWESLKGLRTGKSPGSDGLPPEFYLAFWDILGDLLLSVLNECSLNGTLTASQREGLLRLTYKKDDKRLPKNWRPISLLNTDYKVASKIITNRLKQVMGSIVHQDQTCGVIGRSIFSNLQLVRDVLDMVDKTNEPGILVTLDQEKAFDRVDHDFLMRTLAKFGFGPTFCHWVGIFYNNVFSRIIVNGRLSCPVFLERGVRQGCPLSPLLYVLISEVLSTQIRKCSDIEGFLLPGAGGLQFKISQYADDSTNFLNSEKSLCHLLQSVHKYELGSGARLNTSKSEAMWLGRWRANGASPFGLKWVTKMKILGVFFSNGLVSVDNENWRDKLDRLTTVVNLWGQRDLSFLGRAMILNVLRKPILACSQNITTSGLGHR